MSTATLKEQLKEAIDRMPPELSAEELLDRITLICKVERSRVQSRAGEGLSQDEVRERMQKWLR